MTRVEAPAKINLFLEVLGKRPDGYHDIRSFLTPISLHDELTIAARADGRVETVMDVCGIPDIVGVDLADSEGNLATRAARLLQAETGCTQGVDIRIRKQIPVGGGLGGGSADAAAVLTTLNRLWGTGLSRARLMELGARLGSDIPALLHGGAVLAEGVGDRVTPVASAPAGPRAEWWMVIVNPGFSTSTGDIYQRYRNRLTSAAEFYNNMRLALMTGNARLAAASLFNSLEKTVFDKYPLIRLMVDGLKTAGAWGALVSGSGSSLYALTGSEDQARELEARLRERMETTFWSRVAKTMPDSVMAAHDPLEVRV